jgi:hypothetical protein
VLRHSSRNRYLNKSRKKNKLDFRRKLRIVSGKRRSRKQHRLKNYVNKKSKNKKSFKLRVKKHKPNNYKNNKLSLNKFALHKQPLKLPLIEEQLSDLGESS